jgi:Helix-turn-helix domain
VTERMPSSYAWDEGLVLTPRRVAYALMRLPEVQHLAKTAPDGEVRDVLIAMRRAAVAFERDRAQRGTTSAVVGEQAAPSVEKDFVEVTEARTLLGLKTNRAVRMAIERGRLPAHQGEQGRWRIKVADIELYRDERRGNGRDAANA